MKRSRVAGINFDHMHMGDLLRKVHEHPNAEIVGICDEKLLRMEAAAKNFSIPTGTSRSQTEAMCTHW